MRHPDDYKFWVYILSNRSHTLYIGMTNSLRKRITQHRKQEPGTHTASYQITRLRLFRRVPVRRQRDRPRERA